MRWAVASGRAAQDRSRVCDAGRRGRSAVVRRRRLRASGRLFEEVDAVEAARAQVAFGIARVAPHAVVFRLHVDRAAPVFRRARTLEGAVLPLGFPVLEIQLLDSAVVVLNLDGAVIVVERDDLEERAALLLTIPVPD